MKDKLIEMIKYDYNKAKVVFLPLIYLANSYYVKHESTHEARLGTMQLVGSPRAVYVS